MLASPLRRGLRTTLLRSNRALSTPATRQVKIVEVGPRDGLQNEKTVIPIETKVELIDRLGETGLKMAGTAEVLQRFLHKPGIGYPVLVPNTKGLDTLIELLERHASEHGNSKPLTDEIAVFIAASESFSKANINCSIAESIDRLVPVVRLAKFKGLRVRGYVSTVITCPYEGSIAPERVRDVAKALDQLGCYEISLGDTVGTGTPVTVERPYSPGATGNVATEDIVHALQGVGYTTGVDLGKLSAVGEWISTQLNRPNSSRAGQAWLAKKRREEEAALKVAEKAARAKL
ncbi:hypothetical protein FRB99_004550 [Tulasnella sp. 403]|nr:hypothetical protein FRB99_004550 [Tulasnella sp. 403]